MSSAPSFIAKRYLVANRGNSFMSWITFLSIAGISIGVAAMIVVLSVINGFETELRNRFLAANAHILAFQFPAGLDDPLGWMSTIRKDFNDDVMGVSPFVHSETMVTRDQLMHNILIRGIHPRDRRNVQDMSSLIKPAGALDILQACIDNPAPEGDTSPPPIILGSGLASILNVKTGEKVKLVRPESTTLGELREFTVVGIYDSGLKHYDNKLGIMSLTTAQDFFKMKQRVHGIEIGLKHPNESTKIAARMAEKYSISIKEWQSFNKAMFETMEMERAVIALIVALVAFVASFNILTTLFITVSQKQRSISILKALGSSNWMIQRIFVFQGLYIGLVGSLIGIVLALGISKLLERYQFVDLPDLYLLAKLPIQYDAPTYVTMSVAGTVICVIAGIYPAWVASRVNIVDGFRGRLGTS